MNDKLISFIKAFIFNGLFFACSMAGFEYLKGEPFNAKLFAASFIGFGIVWSLLFNRKNKKEA